MPTLVPDVPGDYVARLLVSDGRTTSAPAFVTLTAISLSPQCHTLLVEPTATCGFSPCVLVRFTSTGTCQQRTCVEAVAARLRAVGIDARALVSSPLPDVPGCVGFRPDIAGTAAGAQCLVEVLGPTFRTEQQIGANCRADGFPYNVRVN
jgi:hypothetical protein